MILQCQCKLKQLKQFNETTVASIFTCSSNTRVFKLLLDETFLILFRQTLPKLNCILNSVHQSFQHWDEIGNSHFQKFCQNLKISTIVPNFGQHRHWAGFFIFKFPDQPSFPLSDLIPHRPKLQQDLIASKGNSSLKPICSDAEFIWPHFDFL